MSRLDADLLPLFQAARYPYGRANLKCAVRARSHRRVTRRTRSTFDYLRSDHDVHSKRRCTLSLHGPSTSSVCTRTRVVLFEQRMQYCAQLATCSCLHRSSHTASRSVCFSESTAVSASFDDKTVELPISSSTKTRSAIRHALCMHRRSRSRFRRHVSRRP